MKHVNEIDSTGANIILQIKKRVELAKKYFLLSNLKENLILWDFLGAMNETQTLNMNNIFPDTDAALEWAADRLESGRMKTLKYCDCHMRIFNACRLNSRESLPS